ncbi:MAG: hypothetical protein EVA89_03350 [Sandaracinaceae bacterium]|nr:MAG: hypothetical protein EVA89_03350 [Sandaracinaceae bacterium]
MLTDTIARLALPLCFLVACGAPEGEGGMDAAAPDPTTDAGGRLTHDGGSPRDDGGAPEDAAVASRDSGPSDAGAAEDASTPSGAPARPGRNLLFFDDFESADRSHSENGVAWRGASAGGGGDAVDVTGERAASGAHALRFTFGGGGPEDDAFAEQRFTLGELREELWIGFRIYFPDGSEPGENRYVHRDLPSGPENNKLLRLWAPTYDGFKWGASMWPSPTGQSYVGGITRGSCVAGPGPIRGTDGFAMTDAHLGRWMLWEIHVRGDDGSGNGVFELWVDGALIASHTDIAIDGAPCAPNAFIDGYLLGWANSGFDVDTHVYIDDVAIWD